MGKSLVIAVLNLTLVATIFLYLGSKHLPWNIQTWKGKSDKEATFFKARHRDTTIGLSLLFFGFLLQLIGVITQN